MPEQDGFELYKRFYPWPERFRLGDPVLVKEITGMRWPEFCQALEETEEDETDPVLILGMAAVAFWQGNPQMSRDKVRRLIERIPQEEFEFVEGDGDAVPPAEAAADGGLLSMTSGESATTPETSSEETSPSDSGVSASSPA